MANHAVVRRAAGAVLVLGSAGAAALAAAWLGSAPLARLVAAVRTGEAASLGLERLLAGGAAAALTTCAGWLLLVTAAGVVEAFTARRLLDRRGVRRLAPATLRRLVVLACGTALGSTVVVGPVMAEPADHTLHGLRLPDRALVAPRDRPGPGMPALGSAARPAPPSQVVVRPGHSLWRVTARRLTPGASPDDVDRGWRLLYRANRAALGPDPDLIHPGDVLDVTALTHDRKDAS